MALKHTTFDWDSFATNAQNTFKQLWQDQDFADVTLATEDGHQIRAHKIILSSNSNVLKKVLLQNPHPNPLIYLRGIKHHNLEQVVSFIYHGQCQVEEHHLENVLAVGQELGVIGLLGDVETMKEEFYSDDIFENDIGLRNYTTSQSVSEKNGFCSKIGKDITENGDNNESSNIMIQSNITEKHNIEFNNLQLVEVTSMLSKSKMKSCDQCSYTTLRTDSINKHKKSKHMGFRFNCDRCDATFMDKNRIKRHIESIHEGIRHGCDKCEKKFSQKSALIQHRQITHERMWSM